MILIYSCDKFSFLWNLITILKTEKWNLNIYTFTMCKTKINLQKMKNLKMTASCIQEDLIRHIFPNNITSTYMRWSKSGFIDVSMRGKKEENKKKKEKWDLMTCWS